MGASSEMAGVSGPGERGRAARVVAAARGPYAVLRGNTSLGLLFGGQVVSSFGDWLYITALVVLVYGLTHAATLVATLTLVRLLPYALFLPLSGALADRLTPKALMITADLGRCACMLGLLAVTSRGTVWMAFPLVFISSCLFSLFRPALGTVLPAVVGDTEKLVQANALMSQIDGLSFVLGPALGGVLVLVGQTRAAFALNAATYLVSAATLRCVRVSPRPRPARPQEGGWLATTLAGYRFLFRENEGVLAAATLAAVGVFVFEGAFWTLAVLLTAGPFRLGSQGLGFLLAVYGGGALLASFLAGPVASRLRVAPGFNAAQTAAAVCAALFGLSPAGALPFACMVFFGIADIFAQVFATTIIQTATPRELLGRVSGAFQSAYVVAMLVGTLVVGPLIAAFGPRAVTVGLALVGLAALAAALPWLLRLESVLGVRLFLHRVPVLAPLARAALDDVAACLRPQSVAAGTAIVRQGECGDRLYLVKDGAVDVAVRGADGRDRHLATLGPTDYFGEIALLHDGPRTATVTARGPVELYTLSRADFQDLLARAAEVRASIGGTGEARLLETQGLLAPRL